MPATVSGEAPPLERQGTLTIDAAERWVQLQSGQRFFLFIEVDRIDADAAIARIAAALKQRRLYDDATIVVAGDHGEGGSGTSLDDAALRVPLLVKQPKAEGAGRRVLAPVQHIDLVRRSSISSARPCPANCAVDRCGPVLDDEDATIQHRPIYAESFAAYYRFGGHRRSR